MSASKTLDAYIRVSRVAGREGERFLSPGEQEKQIRAWAQMQGHAISDDGPDDGVWRELDRSGGTMDRPKLNEVMARVEAGLSDGIIVWRLDRFGRSLIGAIDAIDRIKKAGGTFVSVSDSFDISTPTGEFVVNVLLSMAQLELARIRDNFFTARSRAFERGWHLSSVPPFGYTRATRVDPRTSAVRPDGPLLVDPVNGAAVTGIFERRAAGEPWSAIRAWLADEGIRTFNGGEAFSNAALLAIVRNPVYRGIATGGADIGSRPDAHDALVDDRTWHSAQERRVPRSAAGDGGLVMRGLIRCAGCRYVMALGTRGSEAPKGTRTWRCGDHARGRRCPTRANIIASRPDPRMALEDYLAEQLWAQDEFRSITFEEIDTAEDAAIEAVMIWRERKERHAVNFELEEAIGAAAYNARGASIDRELQSAEAALAEAQRASGRRRGRRRRLREDWNEMTLSERRAEAAAMIQAIFVREPQPGVIQISGNPNDAAADLASRRRYFASRVHIVWADDDAVDVPRQGRRPFHPEKRPNGYRARPFTDFPDANPD
jgi:site-specific DNA recombinase